MAVSLAKAPLTLVRVAVHVASRALTLPFVCLPLAVVVLARQIIAAALALAPVGLPLALVLVAVGVHGRAVALRPLLPVFLPRVLFRYRRRRLTHPLRAADGREARRLLALSGGALLGVGGGRCLGSRRRAPLCRHTRRRRRRRTTGADVEQLCRDIAQRWAWVARSHVHGGGQRVGEGRELGLELRARCGCASGALGRRRGGQCGAICLCLQMLPDECDALSRSERDRRSHGGAQVVIDG